MKIMIDARFYGLENAGLGRYTINLIEQLQKLDHENQYLILLRKKYFDKVKFVSNFEKVLFDVNHYGLSEQIKLPQVIKKNNPDLVHFLHSNVPIQYNGKFVVTVHDLTMYRSENKATTLPLPVYFAKNIIYRRVLKHAVTKSKKIIVPSEFVKDDLVKSFEISKEKIKVTYEGVGISNSKFSGNLSKTESELYFLYVGNAYPHKNLEIAIRAVVGLNKETNRKVNLYIVSSKSKFTMRLQKLVGKLHAQEFVKFMGYVDDETLQGLYEKSVGFIYPSLSEGFGLPGLEAMQAGTIVLCSNISVFKEIYGNHAIYFDPHNEKSVANAMKQTLGLTKQNAEKKIRENRRFTEKYSWVKMAKETLEVYNSFK